MTIAIKPTASGSTIEQDGSAILSIDASGNLTVPNNLSVTGTAPIPDALSTASGSAPSYSARAWVNFNGSGAVAIRESGNVSSITDNGVGDYTINLTTAMPDANYGINLSVGVLTASAGGAGVFTNTFVPTSSALRVFSVGNASDALADAQYFYASIFR